VKSIILNTKEKPNMDQKKYLVYMHERKKTG